MAKPKGAVAAGHELTADAAAEILEDGGNAFDAALGAMMAATVTEPVLASPGGGGFLMARPAGAREPTLFDFFVQTPRAKPTPHDNEPDGFREIVADFGTTTQAFHIGGATSATPGVLPGLFAAHEALGRVPMTRLLEPAIRHAGQGVPMTAFQAFLFEVVGPILQATPEARDLFAPDGALLKEGEIFRPRALQDVYETLAAEGLAFYTKGELGALMLAGLENDHGHLRADDLARYDVALRVPIDVAMGHHRVRTNPAPSAGGALIAHALNSLNPTTGNRRPLTEAVLGGLKSMREVMTGSPQWQAADASDALNDQFRIISEHRQVHRGTTHISVADSDGNIAALTLSNGEGNGIVHPQLGFMVNNMLGEDDVNPGGPFGWQPDRRLSSMMAPTLLQGPDGAVWALGSGGSNRIRSAVFEVVARLIEGRTALDEAVHAPRLHLETDGALDFEDDFPDEERNAIVAYSSEAKPWPERNMFFGGVHVACWGPNGHLEAAADPRRGGATRVI